MNHIALFSNDTTLRDMLNQLDEFNVAYFSIKLDTNQLPKNISLAIFDFDVVHLSLLDEWEQFPRLHLRKMAIVSADNFKNVTVDLESFDNIIIRPFTQDLLEYRTQQVINLRRSYEYISMLQMESKTSLASLMGYPEVIKHMKKIGKEILDDDLIKYMDNMQLATHRLEKLIQFITNMTRIEHLKYFNFRQNEFGDIVEFVEESIAKILKEKSQKLSIFIPENLLEIMCDEWYVRIVLKEILLNASNYSEHNTEIVLSVSTHNSFLICSVKDAGFGMSEAFKSRIFEPWSTDYENVHIREKVGIGMSLYVSKKIIEIHGGKIWFESDVGVGTTFYFTLPLAQDVSS